MTKAGKFDGLGQHKGLGLLKRRGGASGGAEAVTFGALTLAGAGGVAKPAGASSISDAGGTNLVLTTGFAVPDTGGTVTSGTVTWDDGTIWNVTAVADRYDFLDQTEFDAIEALSAAALSGKTAYGKGGGVLAGTFAVASKTCTTPFVIDTASDTSIECLTITACTKVTFAGRIRMQGWPKNQSYCVSLGGANQDIIFDGADIGHGYGSGLAEWNGSNMATEAARIFAADGVTIGTTSQTFGPLTYHDTQFAAQIVGKVMTSGTVHWRVSTNASDTATTGDPTFTTSASLLTTIADPTLGPYYIHVRTASGSADVDLRVEQGLGFWLADAFGGTGPTLNNFQIKNCTIRNVNNGTRAGAIIPNTGPVYIYDNHFLGIYQDPIKVGPDNAGHDLIIARNLVMQPTCLGGRNDDNGDAGDPHSDIVQLVGGQGSGAENIYIVGNTVYPSGRAHLSAGTQHHGVYAAYGTGLNWCYSIGNLMPYCGGAIFGEAQAIPDEFIYSAGNTYTGFAFNDNAAKITHNYDGAAVDALNWGNVASSVTFYSGTDISEKLDNYEYNGNISAFTDIFANYGDLSSATTAAQVEAALTTSGAAAGIGAVANRSSFLNMTPGDITGPDDVINWDNLRPIMSWEDDTDVTASATYTWPTRIVMACSASSTVTPGASTEVQINGGTWTSSPTTCNRLDTIAMRRTSGAASATVTASVTINGFAYSADITSAGAVAPSAFTAGQWTSATGSGASEIDINITALPSDGGSAITALQYSVDAGTTWANLTGTGTGSRTIDQHSDGTTGTLTASTSYDIEVRAVNAIGNGADSDTKATTTGASAPSSLYDFAANTPVNSFNITESSITDGWSYDVNTGSQNIRNAWDLSGVLSDSTSYTLTMTVNNLTGAAIDNSFQMGYGTNSSLTTSPDLGAKELADGSAVYSHTFTTVSGGVHWVGFRDSAFPGASGAEIEITAMSVVAA